MKGGMEMGNWIHRVKIKHLLTKNKDRESIQKAMNSIADVLEVEFCFTGFSIDKFRNIPEGDDVFSPIDYANRLLDKLYDYADRKRIWID